MTCQFDSSQLLQRGTERIAWSFNINQEALWNILLEEDIQTFKYNILVLKINSNFMTNSEDNTKNFSTTMVNDDTTQQVRGRQIRPPLIPSNFEKVYSTQGTYNLKGFYSDLLDRLQKQKETIKRVEENSMRSLQFNGSVMMSNVFQKK